MKRLLVLTILLLSAVFIGNAYAPEPKTFKVYVYVYAEKEDKIEQDIIESHLKRELRALGDVVIVGQNDDWKWRFSVNVLGIKFTDGIKDQWVSIATSFQRRVPKFYFNNYNFVAPSIPVYDYGPVPAHWPKDDLPAWCISYANRFDKELQTWR